MYYFKYRNRIILDHTINNYVFYTSRGLSNECYRKYLRIIQQIEINCDLIHDNNVSTNLKFIVDEMLNPFGVCFPISASDLQGSNFASCIWRAVPSHSSYHPQEVLLAQFSLYMHKSGFKPDSFRFASPCLIKLNKT